MSGLLLAALACASCGSGGDSPLILYPNEAVKAYVGGSHQSGFKAVTASGAVGTDLGPASKDTLTVAAGATFLTDWFATVTVPRVTNARDGREKSGLGDPLAAVSWTALPASLLTPALPQVQLQLAYKRATSTSVYDSEDANWLDVYGTGFDEARAGVDVWWGAAAWKAGCAAVAILPRARSYDGKELAPGRGARVTVTGGYGFHEAGKIIAGAVVERRARRTSGGAARADSAEDANNAFLGGDAQITGTQSLRLTLTRAAAFGRSRNATAADGVTLAWMGAL